MRADHDFREARYPVTYPAVYTDARGSEKTSITNDGEELRMRVRHVDFFGTSFDDWEPAEDTPLELLQEFSLQPRLRELRDFTLKCDIPVPFSRGPGESDACTATLSMTLELGPSLPNGGADGETLQLKLSGPDVPAAANTKTTNAFFEIALNEIQAQLPPSAFIKTCINCDFSDYSPYGQGLFGNHMACFRGIKEEYRAVNSKDALFRVWDHMTEYVSELHLCGEFERRIPERGYRG